MKFESPKIEQEKPLNLEETLEELKIVSGKIVAIEEPLEGDMVNMRSETADMVLSQAERIEKKNELKHLLQLRKKHAERALKLLYKEYKKGNWQSITREQAFLLVQLTRHILNSANYSIRNSSYFEKDIDSYKLSSELNEIEHFSASPEKVLSRRRQNEVLLEYGYIDREEYDKELGEIEQYDAYQREQIA